MGQPMVKRLHDTGFQVCAYNRSISRLTPLESFALCTTEVTQAIQYSDILIMMVSDYDAIDSVIAQQSLVGKTLLQMGTIAPEQSRQLATQVQANGGRYVEAPVLGSIPEVASGSLLIMLGGESADIEPCRPVLSQLGKSIRHLGAVGQAAAVKLALNQLIAALTTAFSTTLAFLQEEGSDIEGFMGILRESALYAPTFDKKLAKMQSRDFAQANFPLQHLLKDVSLFLQAAAPHPIDTRMLKSIQQLLEAALPTEAEHDYSAVYTAVHPRFSYNA